MPRSRVRSPEPITPNIGQDTTGGTSGVSAASTTSSGGTTTGKATTGGSSVAGSTTGGISSSGTAGGTSGTTGGPSNLSDGALCTDNSQCHSLVCGVGGSGHCCSAACTTGDPACGATSCDDTGACTYPASSATCGTDACSASMLTTSLCDGSGTCAAQAAAACPGNLICADSKTCKAVCAAKEDCDTGFVCSLGLCITPIADGAPCADNNACTSGVCDVNGAGNCCTTACNTKDATCGATACDNTGACTYPDSTATCATSCTNVSSLTTSSCDGTGSCVAGVAGPCPDNYACQNITTCAVTCTVANAGCATGAFCDIKNGACCTGLAAADTINVDSATGVDAACCGVGSNAACATITQAMALIDAAQASNVTINATVNGGSGDWAAAEKYPIVLGWGVELNAPGVFFLDNVSFSHPRLPAANSIFAVQKYSVNDNVGYASIVGGPAKLVAIGMDSKSDQTVDSLTIGVYSKSTLYIANASVNGSASNNGGTPAFWVSQGCELLVGQDKSGGVVGTVTIGNSFNAHATNGYDGILCVSDDVANGCTIEDSALLAPGQSGLVIEGQEDSDIQAFRYSSISLTAAPVIGIAPSDAGFGTCIGKPDGLGYHAVYLQGADMTFKNGTVQCVTYDAFNLSAGDGPPTLTLDNTLIQNTELGLYVGFGSATVTNSTFRFNFAAVQQDATNDGHGTIDLSGGGNIIVCNSSVEDSVATGALGVGVYNSGSTSLAADNVAWDTSGPDSFSCSGITSTDTCSCSLTSCDTAGPYDGMDVVTNSNDTGNAITTTGNTLSSISCN